MSYSNSFARELSQLAAQQNSLELPHDLNNYIKEKVISDAKTACDCYLSELKNKVSRGEYRYVNGRRVVSYTTLLVGVPMTILSNADRTDTSAYWIKMLSSRISADALRANGIQKDEYEGLVTYRLDLFNRKTDNRDSSPLFGYRRTITHEFRKGPFTDLYLNTIRDILRRNGVGYRMVLTFTHVPKSPRKKPTVVKTYDFTGSFPARICESFETPRADSRLDLDDFGARMNIELTVSF
ncbi:MAG: hypothetical protein IJN67_14185 [Oscillospiraceae bacterium]|nr:hypothetical protein [Oscillospiraceae bacterium]